MTKWTVPLLTLALAGMGADAFAQGYPGRGSVGYDFARVVDVQPVYEDVSIPEPREECWDEPVTYVSGPAYGPGYGYGQPRSPGAEIVGGIIGGVIGNQFGSGSGRAAATAAGVVLGASIAHENQNRRYYANAPRYERTVSERRCALRETYRSERQLIGYDVTYDYNGTVGRTFSEKQPGTEIRVRVAVEPAD